MKIHIFLSFLVMCAPSASAGLEPDTGDPLEAMIYKVPEEIFTLEAHQRWEQRIRDYVSKNPGATNRLLELAERDQEQGMNWEVIGAPLKALAALPNLTPEEVGRMDKLIRVIAAEKVDHPRRLNSLGPGIYLLAKYPTPEREAFFVQLAKEDWDDTVRFNSLMGLVTMGSKLARPEIEKALQSVPEKFQKGWFADELRTLLNSLEDAVPNEAKVSAGGDAPNNRQKLDAQASPGPSTPGRNSISPLIWVILGAAILSGAYLLWLWTRRRA